jgi:hypothetical protein
MYQEFRENLFGFTKAAINFNRVPRLMQAVAHTWLAIMLGMYFDGASIQDIHSGQGQAHRRVRELFRPVGFKFNPEKSSPMQAEQNFAGVIHNSKDCFSKGSGPVRIREKIVEKAQSLLQSAVGIDSCPPGLASEIRGTNQSLFHGFSGRVGRAAGGPLIQHEYSDTAPWKLSHILRRSLLFLPELQGAGLRKEFRLLRQNVPSIIVASDGRADSSRLPPVSVCFSDPISGERVGAYASVTQKLLSLWGHMEQPIVPVEMSAIVLGVFHILAKRPMWKGRDFVWYEDSAVVLSAMVGGKSRSAKMNRVAMVVHLTLAMLSCRVWFEYGESNANWMDEASRVGEGGP